ncbi:filamentous hemagglutinin N-terminal domain-containing protein, partial [Hyphomonas beringensis]|uniref:two-partner secretion domain-containing protein n=1 Tax=Hyphomonas beringensis TaxID=1280946 RepID=UPI0019D712D1
MPLIAPSAAAQVSAQAVLPTDGVVTAGSASISHPSGTSLQVDQSTDMAIVDWTSFSIAEGHSVYFNQPGTYSATLNRVSGDTSSTIAGSLTATGRVLLVNPNGIAITESGTVDAGAFVASTLDIADADF